MALAVGTGLQVMAATVEEDGHREVRPSRMRPGYHGDSALTAELDHTRPGAAASLREGMIETLTMLRLNVPPTLTRTGRAMVR